MSDHAQGPWLAEHQTDVDLVRRESNLSVVAVMAREDNWGNKTQKRVTEANARLMAASPELLEACEESIVAFRTNLAKWCHKDEQVMHAAFQKCVAAVAKAKGEA